MAKLIKASAEAEPEQSLCKRCFLVFISASIFILLGLIFWFVEEQLRDPNRYPLKIVKVEGDLHYLTPSDIQSAVVDIAQGGWFSVDLNQIRQTVEAIPWVEHASIRRIWPATIELNIVEQKPYVRWGAKGLLNLRAESYLPRNGVIPQYLPLLSGPEGSEKQVAKRYVAINKQFKPLNLALKGLTLNQRGAWTLLLDNEIRVELGVDQIETKLQRLLNSYPILNNHPEQGKLIKIDCRYPNGLAVLRTPLTKETKG